MPVKITRKYINLSVDKLTIGNGAFNLPIADGSLGQTLATDGAGNVTWEDTSGAPQSLEDTLIIGNATGTESIDVSAGTEILFDGGPVKIYRDADPLLNILNLEGKKQISATTSLISLQLGIQANFGEFSSPTGHQILLEMIGATGPFIRGINGTTSFKGRLELAQSTAPHNLTADRRWYMPDENGTVMVGEAFNTLVANPTSSENGYSLIWNDSAGEFTLANVSGGGLVIGSTITGGTANSVLFVGAMGELQQDNANFSYNDTLNRLGIGTNAPQQEVHIKGDSAILRLETISTLGKNFIDFYDNIGEKGYIGYGSTVNDNFIIANKENGGKIQFLSTDALGSTSTGLVIDEDSKIEMSALSGVGTRMVTADATGILSTQAIPSGIAIGDFVSGSSQRRILTVDTSNNLAVGRLMDNGSTLGINSLASNIYFLIANTGQTDTSMQLSQNSTISTPNSIGLNVSSNGISATSMYGIKIGLHGNGSVTNADIGLLSCIQNNANNKTTSAGNWIFMNNATNISSKSGSVVKSNGTHVTSGSLPKVYGTQTDMNDRNVSELFGSYVSIYGDSLSNTGSRIYMDPGPTATTMIGTETELVSTSGASLTSVLGGNIAINTNSTLNIGMKIKVQGGSSNYSLRLEDGKEASGKILTSDSQGNASWQNPTSLISTIGIEIWQGKKISYAGTGRIFFINYTIPADITIATAKMAFAVSGNGITCCAIYRGSGPTAILIGQSNQVTNPSDVQSYTMTAEVGQTLSFTGGESVVLAVSLDSIVSTPYGIECPDTLSVAWFEETEVVSGGSFPATATQQDGTIDEMPAIQFFA